MNIKTNERRSDCAQRAIRMAGYEMYWGDGEPGTPIVNPNGPDISEQLGNIFDGDFDAVILAVLETIKDRRDLWLREAQ